MTAYPNWTAGEVVTEAKLDLYTTNLTAICIAQRTAAQSVVDNTTVDLALTGTDLLDPNAWHDPAGGAPERITPTIAGWYLVIGHAEFTSATTTTARRVTRIAKNGTAVHQGIDVAVATGLASLQAQDATATVSLNGSTDFVTLQVFQDDTGGSARNFTGFLSAQLIYPT